MQHQVLSCQPFNRDNRTHYDASRFSGFYNNESQTFERMVSVPSGQIFFPPINLALTSLLVKQWALSSNTKGERTDLLLYPKPQLWSGKGQWRQHAGWICNGKPMNKEFEPSFSFSGQPAATAFFFFSLFFSIFASISMDGREEEEEDGNLYYSQKTLVVSRLPFTGCFYS